MMDTIKLTYSHLYNAGDLLNVDLVERFSGKKVVRSKVYDADMMAIGGALFGAQFSGGGRGILQRGLGVVYGPKPLYVWGSGFLYGDNQRRLYRRNLIVRALRGEKTRQKLSKLTGDTYDQAVLADPGLLVDLLLEKRPKKKYEIGVIPHMYQKNERIFSGLEGHPAYHLIEIQRPPREVAEEIAACETIVSSSLHGLVFADSLHVPSLRLVGQTPLLGGAFKFEDYYSAFGVRDNPWRDTERLPDAQEILSRHCTDFSLVEEKKKALVRCFPRW